MTSPPMSQAVLRSLQRISEAAPDAVTMEAVQELDTAAQQLVIAAMFTSSLGMNVDQTLMLPAGMVPAFVKATTKLNTHLKQKQQGRQNLQPQQQIKLAGLASALLHVWNCIGKASSEAWLMAVMPTIGPASELALTVLTGPQGGLAPNTANSTFQMARQFAAFLITQVGPCVYLWDGMIEAEAIKRAGPGSAKRGATREEAVIVSDIVQRAVLLHNAVFVYECRQRLGASVGSSSSSSSSGGGSSGSWAPKQAAPLLQQLHFPLDAAQNYTAAVRKATPEQGQPHSHLTLSHMYLQSAISVRMLGLKQPDGQWASRYAGYLAAAASSDSTVTSHPEIIYVQHVMAPGFHPAQLVYLTLEFLCVSGLGQDTVTSDLAALGWMAMMLAIAQKQVWAKVPAAEANVLQEYAEGCVDYIWLSLGKQLQRAAGVAEAELEGDGSQPADAAAATGGSSTGNNRYIREAVEMDLPAAAAARLRLLWEEYSNCLLNALTFYTQVFSKLPNHIYVRQPMRASRVLEGAMRAIDQARIEDPQRLNSLLSTIMDGHDITSIVGAAESTELLLTYQPGIRSCSQLITTLKVVSQPLARGVTSNKVFGWRMQLACCAASTGPLLHTWATGDPYTSEQRRQAVVQAAHSMSMEGARRFASDSQCVKLTKQAAIAAPCYTLWLAATGRGLLTVGRLMQTAQPWLQYNVEECQGAFSNEARGWILALYRYTHAGAWLQQQLQDLQKNPDEAAAVRVPPALLQELCTLADALAPRFNYLGRLCLAASSAVVMDPAIAAVFEAHLQGCADGSLPEGLQRLGAKVWTAWPQKYACNDDQCLNLSCLTEHSCGRSKCTACQTAYYCCKEHQARHWKQHKQVCKHLQQLAKAASSGGS